MSKVDASKFGSSKPKITPDDLEGDVAVLTISGYEEFDVDDASTESGKRRSAVLMFEQTEDRVLYLNKGMIETLVEKLGDDSDGWLGQQVPVEKHVAKFGNEKFPKVRVVPAEEWGEYIKPARKAAKAAKGRGR